MENNLTHTRKLAISNREGQLHDEVHQSQGSLDLPSRRTQNSQPEAEQQIVLPQTTVDGHHTESCSHNGPSVSSNINRNQRNKWTLEQCKEIIYCYFYVLSYPNGNPTTKATFELWKERNSQLSQERSYVDANKLATTRRDILKRHRLTDNEILNIKQSINQAKMEPPSEHSDEFERPADLSDQHHSVEETTITVIDTSLSDMRSAMPGEALTLHGHIAEQWEKTKHTKLHERKVLKKLTGPKVSQVIDNANKALTLVIAEYPVTNLTDLNHLFYATATVVTNMISEDRPKEQTLSHKPRLTRAERIQARMDKQIAGWRKEVSWTSEILNERNTKNVQLKKGS
jgi:hypothetical protein